MLRAGRAFLPFGQTLCHTGLCSTWTTSTSEDITGAMIKPALPPFKSLYTKINSRENGAWSGQRFVALTPETQTPGCPQRSFILQESFVLLLSPLCSDLPFLLHNTYNSTVDWRDGLRIWRVKKWGQKFSFCQSNMTVDKGRETPDTQTFHSSCRIEPWCFSSCCHSVYKW